MSERYSPTYDELRGLNCVVTALSILLRRRPDDVRAAINAAALPGEGAFWSDTDGQESCLNVVSERFLLSIGWKQWRRQPPDYRMIALPPTCLLQVPGHAIAMIDGFVFDTVSPKDWGHEILGFWEPPSGDDAWKHFRESEEW